MAFRNVLLCCLLAGFLSSCSLFSFLSERDDFIKVHGTHFIHNGRPYYFAGANVWYGFYMGSPGQTGDRARLRRELDSLKSLGIDNLRLLASSEESYLPGSVKPALQTSPGVLDDSLLQGLDFLLAEMAKRHMHGVLYLNNYWEWSGGMTVYNAWSGRAPVDPNDSTQGWGAFMDSSAAFYSNVPANDMFRHYVRQIIGRKNSVNGRQYAEDPTIMAWELANEPRPGKGGEFSEQNLPAFYRWIDRTALYIHSLDTNHLVSTGSEGTVGTLQSAEYFLDSHRTPNIDYLTMHVWPLNWGWFDPNRIRETLPVAEHNALEYIESHYPLARELGKPIVLEEFGLARDRGAIRPGTPTTARDQYYSLVLRALYDSARAGAPVAGYNVWAWGGEGSAQHPDGIWRKGDPFTGDPPQEPQGRNSTFTTDVFTLDILRDSARKMNRLGVADSIVVSR